MSTLLLQDFEHAAMQLSQTSDDLARTTNDCDTLAVQYHELMQTLDTWKDTCAGLQESNDTLAAENCHLHDIVSQLQNQATGLQDHINTLQEANTQLSQHNQNSLLFQQHIYVQLCNYIFWTHELSCTFLILKSGDTSPFLQILSDDLVLARDHLHSFQWDMSLMLDICTHTDGIFNQLHSVIETAKHSVSKVVVFDPRMEDPVTFASQYVLAPSTTAWSVGQSIDPPMLGIKTILPQFLSAHPSVSPTLGSNSSSPIVIEDDDVSVAGPISSTNSDSDIAPSSPEYVPHSPTASEIAALSDADSTTAMYGSDLD
ncbi:hypothetical protein GYMLUDRAFT_55773 [Collybiopsis luxurians FD-317 M1]|nr:hypothetical protein GYMLUDRAFT_55773 [Collybiopsis luxurians FD-317 M1]